MAAPDTDTIVALFDSRRMARHALHRMAGEIQKITRGTFAVPLPEMDKDEEPAIANLVAIGVDQHAMRIASVMPEVDFNPVRMGIKGYKEKARKRRQAMLGILEANKLKLKGRRRARRLVAYASAPVMIRPDFERGIPIWHVRDPLASYPAPTADPDDMLPEDCIFEFTRTWRWLQATYPDKATQLHRRDTRGDTEFTLLEYVDSEEIVLVVLGHRSGGGEPLSFYSWDRGRTASGLVLPNGLDHHAGTREAVELERTPNYARMPLAVCPGRITTDDAPAGQFDSLIGKYRALAEMDALTRIAIKRGIYPDTWVIGKDNQAAEVLVVPNGVKGRLGELKGGDIKTVNENPTYLSFPAQDRLERNMRVEGAVPAELGGESASNVRTGRRGDSVLSAAIDFPIQEHQEILGSSYEEEIKVAIAVQKGFMGDRTVSMYVNWKGAKGPVEYKPDELFDNDDVKVTYAYVGADLNDLTLQIGQRLGIGTMSQTRAMEIDPMVDDVEAEKDQIVADRLMAAVLTSIETLAADSTGPYQPVDIAWIAEKVTSGEMELPEAIQKAQERAQQRQATSGPPGTEEGAALPGSPEAQPGMSQPGQGVETPIGPSEGTGGLAALLSGLSVPSRFERIAG